MPTEKQLNTRITQKIDTTTNWGRATNFKPKKGEIIVYQDQTGTAAATFTGLKVGDGVSTVSNLPFVDPKISVNGSTYSVNNGTITLPNYPTTLPASDVYAWAKASTKPSYTFSEITSRGEAYLEWGGRNLQGSIGPLGMSISEEHSANRIALIPGAALSFEYSSDGGTTWTDYGYSNENKTAFCTSSHSVPVGRPNSGTDLVANQSMTRITLTAQNGTTGYVYTDPRKMLVRVSSATALSMKVEVRTGTNYKSGGAWGTFGTYNVSGWSGWNDIPLILGTLGGGTTQTGNYWQLRLTFTCTTVNPSYPKTAEILAIRIYGTNGWTTPSTMANTGHLYTYDMNKNASFPAAVLATSFTEGGTTLSSKYAAKSHVHGNLTSDGKLGVADKVAVTDGSKFLTISSISTTELGYLSGVSSNIQTQLNSKASSSDLSSYLPLTGGTLTGTLTTKDITLYTASGDSPRLTFQRGTLTDTYNDWSIYDSGGSFYIQQRGNGSTEWETRATFTQSTVNFAGSILEGGTSLANKYLGISAKAADSSKLNGQEASYYLNYNNLTNKPTIPTTYVSTVNGASGAITNVAKTNAANVFTGNNLFEGAFSAEDGASLSADSGDVILDVSPSGIDLNSRYGVNIYASERGYVSASEPIRYASGVAPSDSGDLVTKSYVDNKTYTTSIATSSGTNQLTLAFGTKYALTAGGTSYIFTMPSNPNTNQTVKVGSSTFGSNAAVGLVAGTRITVTPDTTNNTITIATSATADSAITNAQIDTLF